MLLSKPYLNGLHLIIIDGLGESLVNTLNSDSLLAALEPQLGSLAERSIDFQKLDSCIADLHKKCLDLVDQKLHVIFESFHQDTACSGTLASIEPVTPSNSKKRRCDDYPGLDEHSSTWIECDPIDDDQRSINDDTTSRMVNENTASVLRRSEPGSPPTYIPYFHEDSTSKEVQSAMSTSNSSVSFGSFSSTSNPSVYEAGSVDEDVKSEQDSLLSSNSSRSFGFPTSSSNSPLCGSSSVYADITSEQDSVRSSNPSLSFGSDSFASLSNPSVCESGSVNVDEGFTSGEDSYTTFSPNSSPPFGSSPSSSQYVYQSGSIDGDFTSSTYTTLSPNSSLSFGSSSSSTPSVYESGSADEDIASEKDSYTSLSSDSSSSVYEEITSQEGHHTTFSSDSSGSTYEDITSEGDSYTTSYSASSPSFANASEYELGLVYEDTTIELETHPFAMLS